MIWVFEIFCQPIPAKLQQQAAIQLKEITQRYFPDVEAYCTHRRLTCVVSNLPTHITHTTEEIRGPKTSLPQEIVDKFAQKHKITASHLIQKGDYWHIPSKEIKLPMEEVLQKLALEILNNFTWPRTIKWLQNSNFSWIRPIDNIFSMLDDKHLPIHIEYLPQKPHTYSSTYQTITIPHAKNYEIIMQENNIQLSYQKRLKSLEYFLGDYDYHKNDKILEELACAGEAVYPFICNLTHKSNLPNHFINTCAQEHQQAIGIYKEDTLTAFMLVAQKPPTKIMQADCSNLISHRIQDMEFLHNIDQQTSLEDWKENLKHLPMHAKLGSIYDKVVRLQTVTEKYLPHLTQDIEYFKLDLSSKLVQEFPTLQQHYIAHRLNLPHLTDTNHTNYKIIQLLDNLDSLIQFFSLELKINSSQDPLGLKRMAHDVIKYGLQIPNLTDIQTLIQLLAPPTFTQQKQLMQFLYERLNHHLNTKVHFPSQQTSVLSIICNLANHINNFWKSKEKLLEMKNFDLQIILTTYKRLVNFIKNKNPESLDNHADEQSQHLLPLLEKPITLPNLHQASLQLTEFFENNLVLDVKHLNYRIALLQAFQAMFDKYCSWDTV